MPNDTKFRVTYKAVSDSENKLIELTKFLARKTVSKGKKDTEVDKNTIKNEETLNSNEA